MAPRRKSISERFWSKVNKNGPTIRPELGPCWLWTGALKENGYGVISVGGRAAGIEYVHRVAYEVQVSRIPKGKIVMHRCDNRKCVRASHLDAATQSDNIRDMVAKGRRVEYDRSGENNPRAVLTEVRVEEIKYLRKTGRTLTSLAAQFGVTHSTIHRAITGKAWAGKAAI